MTLFASAEDKSAIRKGVDRQWSENQACFFFSFIGYAACWITCITPFVDAMPLMRHGIFLLLAILIVAFAFGAACGRWSSREHAGWIAAAALFGAVAGTATSLTVSVAGAVLASCLAGCVVGLRARHHQATYLLNHLAVGAGAGVFLFVLAQIFSKGGIEPNVTTVRCGLLFGVTVACANLIADRDAPAPLRPALAQRAVTLFRSVSSYVIDLALLAITACGVAFFLQLAASHLTSGVPTVAAPMMLTGLVIYAVVAWFGLWGDERSAATIGVGMAGVPAILMTYDYLQMFNGRLPTTSAIDARDAAIFGGVTAFLFVRRNSSLRPLAMVSSCVSGFGAGLLLFALACTLVYRTVPHPGLFAHQAGTGYTIAALGAFGMLYWQHKSIRLVGATAINVVFRVNTLAIMLLELALALLIGSFVAFVTFYAFYDSMRDSSAGSITLWVLFGSFEFFMTVYALKCLLIIKSAIFDGWTSSRPQRESAP